MKIGEYVYVHQGPHAGQHGRVEYQHPTTGLIAFRSTQDGSARLVESENVKPSLDLLTIRSTRDLESAVSQYGPRYFFSPATRAAWNSELEPWIWQTPKGVVFVTSELKKASPWDTKRNHRRWTVRLFDGGRVIDISEFGAFGGDGPAYRCAENYFRKETSG